ncbi:hypothetical protein KPL26_03200 [Clostridium algidicarnis]|uniref:hypothetical protein n=1 Tax=Clostridium algidicarnis TaxID=37659 RepID=UPI001C0CB37B|nr:hypothetical protein [Clostridium algidicarnis]MBU3195669.1 hypothetical protein [Clostridium algidicarnis]
MSKFGLNLSYKNIKILKHSLEQRIEQDEYDYNKLKSLEDNLVTEDGRAFIKEHEEHLKCLEALVEEMKRCGYRHGDNVFGNKYKV